LPLCGCTALNRGRYGWIAYIDHFPCQSEAELERFYKRSGMLLSLFHVLNTTDVHSDNLIAAGEHPMLVDAETLITPPLLMAEQREQNEWAEMLAVRKLEDSVTKSAMLPSWKADRAGNALDMSGLGATGGEEVEVSVWQGAQTDQVTQDIAKGRKERNRNVPFPEGMLAQPSRFVDQIEAGFKEIYQLLMENRDVLLEPDSPFENLARAPMRLVFRDTKVYFSLLKQSLEPGVMREGVDRSIHLAILNRILCISNPKSRHLHVVKAEQDALEQLDIPSFTFSPRDRNLRSGKARVDPKYFATPGYERVREKLMRLSLKECEEQCELIRGSFYAKMLNEPTKNDEELSRPYTVGPRRTGEESDFLKAALAIREDLGRRVVSGTDGSCTWIALSYVPRFRGYRLMPLGVGLYDGAAGIALFLAASEKVTGCRAGVPSAHEALKPVRRFLERALERNLWQRENKGEIEAGLLIYPLILLGQLLNDESLIALARSSAALLTEEVFEQDHDFGILHGTAGILLGLLTLNRIEPSERTMATAISAGEYLLNNTLMKNEETGLVGSSLSLRRLCAATGDERFAEAAAVAEKRKIGLADCAVGGLAELDALRSVSGSWTPNLENGVRSDSLYGGTFGIVDFYIEMALRTGADENLAKAREIAAAAIDRAEHCRKYRLFGELPEKAFLPGFFHGLSGIGYELMRLSAPGAIPSVLMSDLL